MSVILENGCDNSFVIWLENCCNNCNIIITMIFIRVVPFWYIWNILKWEKTLLTSYKWHRKLFYLKWQGDYVRPTTNGSHPGSDDNNDNGAH